MRLILSFFVYGLTIAVIVAVGAGYWAMQEYKKPGPLQQEMVFTVERGQSAGAIAHDLHAQNMISDAFLFRAGLKF